MHHPHYTNEVIKAMIGEKKMMPDVNKSKVIEKRVYQAKGAFNYMGDEQADPVEFQRMFEADSISLVEQLTHDWLVQLHGKLRFFEIRSIGLAEDIITWEN